MKKLYSGWKWVITFVTSRSPWPRGLRRRSAAVSLLGFEFESRRGYRRSSLLNIITVQVEVSASGRVCVCWVWSSTTVTLYTHNEQVEEYRLKKTFVTREAFPPAKDKYTLVLWTKNVTTEGNLPVISQTFEVVCMSIRLVLSRDQWTFFLPLCSQFEEKFNDVMFQIMRLREFRKKP